VLYAGGQFTTIGTTGRSKIAAINAATGAVTGWNPNADETVTKILPVGGTIYVGGTFVTIGGAPRNNLAALNPDPTTGSATAWISNTNGGGVFAMWSDGTTLYVTGGFTAIG